MQLEDRDIRFLVGNKEILSRMPMIKTLEIFHRNILLFLEELSSKLLRESELRKYPDVAAFAFWIRKKNLERQRETSRE